MVETLGERGKIFTDVVPKDPVKVILQTRKHIIKGTYYLRKDERLVDSINNHSGYFPLTDVQVLKSSDKTPLYKTKFMILNHTKIDWIMPVKEMIDG